jgi:hypothetical protein
MSTRFFKLFMPGFVSMLAIAATAFAAEYVVKKHDVLSVIAHRAIHGRIWGHHGAIQKILALNPKIKNPDFIFPGQILQLPNAETLTAREKNSPVRSIAEITPASSPVDGFEEHSALSVAPTFGFSRISATDKTSGANSTLGSALNLGASVQWRQFWSETFQTALIFSGESQSYSTTSTQTLDHSSFFLGTVGVEGRWGKDLAPQFISHIEFIQSPFIRGESQTANTLDVVTIPAVGIGAEIPIYHSRIFLMSAEVVGNYLAPSNQSSYM